MLTCHNSIILHYTLNCVVDVAWAQCAVLLVHTQFVCIEIWVKEIVSHCVLWYYAIQIPFSTAHNYSSVYIHPYVRTAFEQEPKKYFFTANTVNFRSSHPFDLYQPYFLFFILQHGFDFWNWDYYDEILLTLSCWIISLSPSSDVWLIESLRFIFMIDLSVWVRGERWKIATESAQVIDTSNQLTIFTSIVEEAISQGYKLHYYSLCQSYFVNKLS